jgi:hypothetical protein
MQMKDNIKMDLREIRRGGVELVNLAQDTEEWWILVNKEINLGDP